MTMRRRWIVPALLLLTGAAAGILLSQRGREAPTPPRPVSTVQIPVPVRQGNDVVLKNVPQTVDRPNDPEAALNALFAEAQDGAERPAAVPRGTRILSFRVSDGRAVLNLGSEFSALSKGGSHGESLAQEAICRVLAQFPSIKTVTVQVDGKTYEGEHSGAWEDLPVKDADSSSHDG